eukprot:TRINITY_DN21564_c0_g1_i1.p1 TRINITY_DN21564_c0_g1~~TRINITY_DN21564_c0_g1_i1.p1  ORF type:complete len:288 (+),score=32.94 TRINITY_DN21564_c0_g1_i1:35-898(+)
MEAFEEALRAGVDCELEKALSFTGKSALCIAYERALETDREDALFKDPHAQQLAGTCGKTFSAGLSAGAAAFGFADWPEFHQQWTAVRTAFLDQWIADNLPEGGQVVNLGAGVCTRPFRLDALKKASNVFEVDREEVNKVKAKILDKLNLTPLCPRVVLATDLSTNALEADLKAAGWDPKKPTVWLLEGLIMYIKNVMSAPLMKSLGPLSAPGSAVAINFVGVEPGKEKYDREGVSPWEGPELETLLKESGWAETEVQRYGGPKLNFGRFPERFAPNPSFSFALGKK